MKDGTDIVDMVDEVSRDHKAGIIAEEGIEEEVVELVRIIENERSKGRVESEELVRAREELFNELCLKDYLDQCEPVNCVHRITGACEYIALLQRLNTEERRRISP